MNSGREWSLLGKVPVLEGGQAPACWHRELAKVTSKHSQLQRACEWVESADSGQIRLRRGPLMGSCLSELTVGLSKSAASPSEDFQPASDRKRQTAHSLKLGRRKSEASNAENGEPTRRHRFQPMTGQPSLVAEPMAQRPLRTVTKVDELPHQVSAGFLNRCVFQPSLDEGVAPNRSAVSSNSHPTIGETNPQAKAIKLEHWPERRTNLGANAGKELMRRQSIQQMPGTVKTPRANVLSANAAKHPDSLAKFRQMVDRMSNRAESKIHPAGVQSNDAENRQLLRQWSMPIGSPQISAEALRRWAMLKHAIAEPDQPPTNCEKTAFNSGTGKSKTALAGSRPNDAAKTGKMALHHSSADSQFALPGGVVDPWPDAPVARMPVNGVITETTAGAASPNYSAAIAPELPPMLPPPEIGMPILPLATSSVQRAARDEALAVEEDLDSLAAKIKFILDEQARRHGIDV